MIQIILHRVNSILDLEKISDNKLGCEIDVRSHTNTDKKLILAHDPWVEGDSLESWLNTYSKKRLSGPLILNTKEDGLEERCIQLLNQHGISNFFFLDTAMPTLVRWSMKRLQKTFAVRVSKYENLETVLNFQGKVEWCWVDCFDGEPISSDMLNKINSLFKICLVSPELNGGDEAYLPPFARLASYASAICTKYPKAWSQILDKKKPVSLS